MNNITQPDVLAFSVMAPSPDEQPRIAAQTPTLEALKTHKQGLMQQRFRSPEAAV